jgi:fumarate hydratase class I
MYRLLAHSSTKFNRQLKPNATAAVAVAAAAKRGLSSTADFHYQELFDLSTPSTPPTPYRKLTSGLVKTLEVDGKKFLQVQPEALRLLSAAAMRDIAHLLRPGHLQQLALIMKDPEATENDKFVALELLKNANIASNFILPGCQDTGTAIISGKRGQYVLTDGKDEEHLSRGVYDTYTTTNLRFAKEIIYAMLKWD